MTDFEYKAMLQAAAADDREVADVLSGYADLLEAERLSAMPAWLRQAAARLRKRSATCPESR